MRYGSSTDEGDVVYIKLWCVSQSAEHDSYSPSIFSQSNILNVPANYSRLVYTTALTKMQRARCTLLILESTHSIGFGLFIHALDSPLFLLPQQFSTNFVKKPLVALLTRLPSTHHFDTKATDHKPHYGLLAGVQRSCVEDSNAIHLDLKDNFLGEHGEFVPLHSQG